MPKQTLELMDIYLSQIFTTTDGLTPKEYLENLLNRISKIQNEQPELSDYRLLLQSELATTFTVEYLEISNVSGLRKMFLGKTDEIAQKILKVMAAPNEAGPEPVPSAPDADTYADENKDDGPDGNGHNNDAASTANAGALAFKAAKTRLKDSIMTGLTAFEREQLTASHKDQGTYARWASSKIEFIFIIQALTKQLRETVPARVSYDSILEAVVTYMYGYMSNPSDRDSITRASLGGHLISKTAQFVDAHSALLRNPEKCIADFEKCSLIFISEVNSSFHGQPEYETGSQFGALKYLQDAYRFATEPGPNAENDLDWERIGGALKNASQKNDVTSQLAQHVMLLVNEAKQYMEQVGENPAVFLAGLEKNSSLVLNLAHSICHLKRKLKDQT